MISSIEAMPSTSSSEPKFEEGKKSVIPSNSGEAKVFRVKSETEGSIRAADRWRRRSSSDTDRMDDIIVFARRRLSVVGFASWSLLFQIVELLDPDTLGFHSLCVL